MASPAASSDEPVSPAGRLFLQPNMDTIIHCTIRLHNPIDPAAMKSTVSSSLMIQHPRFRSLLVRDRDGQERWRRTDVDVDKHLIVIDGPVETGEDRGGGGDDDSDSAAASRYVADLTVGSPMSLDKPLWEIHLLMAHRCMVFRIHHALGDGISLMSMLLACCRSAEDAEALPETAPKKRNSKLVVGRKDRDWLMWVRLFWSFLQMVWFNLAFTAEFVARSASWIRDRKSAISGGEGVELWPRKLATAVFLLDDMKAVKTAVPNSTINDVLFGVVSSGLSRYLDHRSPNDIKEGQRLTGVAMVNLRQQPGLQELSNMMQSGSGAEWGNRFGMLLLPVYYHRVTEKDPLGYLKRAKVMVDRKKQSLEAPMSYKAGYAVMNLLGPKYACDLNYRIVCNTSFTISNVVGPQEEITIAGNPVSYIRVTTSGLPHALTMHMVSYAGKAHLQLLVAKDIIPDPEFLAKCFEDALLAMKDTAISTEQ